jgi:hypothetical protein
MCPFLDKIQKINGDFSFNKPVLSQIAIRNLLDIYYKSMVENIFNQLDNEITQSIKNELNKMDLPNVFSSVDGSYDKLKEQLHDINPEFHTEISENSLSFQLKIDNLDIYKVVEIVKDVYCENGSTVYQDNKNNFSMNFLNEVNDMIMKRTHDDIGKIIRGDDLSGVPVSNVVVDDQALVKFAPIVVDQVTFDSSLVDSDVVSNNNEEFRSCIDLREPEEIAELRVGIMIPDVFLEEDNCDCDVDADVMVPEVGVDPIAYSLPVVHFEDGFGL